MVLAQAENRLGREITIDEMSGGQLGTILIPADYILPTKVTTFKLDPLSFILIYFIAFYLHV
jgi:hypothetical protein